jgi:hypothetical protein
MRNFPISTSFLDLGSWLDPRTYNSSFAVGCRVCAAAPGASKLSAFANYTVCTPGALQDVNFTKHQANQRHKDAVQFFLSSKGLIDSVALGSVGAPSVAEYKTLCQSIIDGKGTCTIAKQAKMTFTVSEAIKSVDQKHLEACHSVALFRDESKSRLALRFRSVSKELVEHSGLLGQDVDFGTGAAAITKSTGKVMKRFCSRFCNAPGRPAVKGFVMKHLFRKLRISVRTITVDSAADEVLSGEMMRSSVLSGMQRRLTPNMKFLILDKTHGSRRLVSRGWGADAYLNDNITMFARGRGSISRIIQNSPAIRTQYNMFCRSSFRGVDATVKNMRSAKHRYESMQKPFGRNVLFIHACIKTAQWCSLTRGGDDAGNNSKIWLEWIDSERCLQASMQADAADQTMMLTRFLDNEKVDASEGRGEVSQYLNTIDGLFGERAACLEVFGYTKHMLTTLRSPLVWHVGSRTCSLGSSSGVPVDIIERCLERMRCWITLMKATAAVEFPSFEIMHALGCVVLKFDALLC